MNNRKFIVKKFKEVREMGYVASRRKSDTGIGKTFETMVGVIENNIDAPDLAGYEIKSHRGTSNSYVTLFTKAPTFPKGANAYLRDKFGTLYEDGSPLKKLHTSIFANKNNAYEGKYTFKLIVDSQLERIRIAVFSLKSGKLLDETCGYSYESIQKVISKKMKNLFYVTADVKKSNGIECFWYKKADVYENPSFEKFIFLLKNGKIMFDIRIGSYKTGKNKGKAHDHGSCFRIRENDLIKLYLYHEKID